MRWGRRHIKTISAFSLLVNTELTSGWVVEISSRLQRNISSADQIIGCCWSHGLATMYDTESTQSIEHRNVQRFGFLFVLVNSLHSSCQQPWLFWWNDRTLRINWRLCFDFVLNIQRLESFELSLRHCLFGVCTVETSQDFRKIVENFVLISCWLFKDLKLGLHFVLNVRNP